MSKMNYIKQINAFNDFLIYEQKLSTAQIALWYALMSVNNKTNWSKKFDVANVVLESLTATNKRTILRSRQVLKKYGLIDYKRNGQKATTYTLVRLYDVEDVASDVTPSEQDTSLPKTPPKTLHETPPKTLDTSPITKLNKTKLNKTNKNTSSQVYDADDPNYKLAKLLFEEIRINDPKFKEPNLQKWANDIRLTHERDERDYDEIEKVIKWVQQDDFWKTNVLSPAKLRKRYSQLIMKIRDKPQQQSYTQNDDFQRQLKKAGIDF